MSDDSGPMTERDILIVSKGDSTAKARNKKQEPLPQ